VPEYTIGIAYDWGCIDTLEVYRSGLIRLNCWIKEKLSKGVLPQLFVNGLKVEMSGTYRTYRPDVFPQTGNSFSGRAFEWFVRTDMTHLGIQVDDRDIFKSEKLVSVTIPHYDGLFSESRVLHRGEIYGSGPPTTIATPVIIELAKSLAAPILDFGCGIGALLRELRSCGMETYGLELARNAISKNLIEGTDKFITLYDGVFPVPFKNNAFRAVVCTEVLEHIPDYEQAIREIARIATHTAIFTVPDISAIPSCYEHGVIPWHLLEATHLNFFTQLSLTNLLKKHFRVVESIKLYPSDVNGTKSYTTLAAIARL